MASMLENLVAEYAERCYPDATPGNRYSAQRWLEQTIVDEIVLERAVEINERAKELRESEELDEALRDTRVVIVECVFLALFVGLLVSHLYTAAEGLYRLVSPGSAEWMYVLGSVVLIVIVAGLTVWIVVGRLAKRIRSIYGKKDRR